MSLSINCLLLGGDSSNDFVVEIENTKTVEFLKDLIKKKWSPHLNHVAASDLTVWKVSLSVDAITPELTIYDVGERQELHSMKKISSIFVDAPVRGHIHILVETPFVNGKPSQVFPVEVEKTKTIEFLKELIKKKWSPHLDHLAASDLTVWKVSLSVDTITPELTIYDVGECQELHSMKKISSIFVDAPVRGHIHILVETPFVDENPSQVFPVEVEKTKTIEFLKELIKQQESPRFGHVAASDLILSQVSLPLDNDLEESVKTVDLTPLDPFLQLSQVFTRVERNRLHVVVQLPTFAIRRKRALPEPEDMFSRLKRSKIATTAPSVYERLQLEPSEEIIDDLPKPDPDIPSVALLYQGFGHFLDIVDGRDDVPGLDDIDVRRLYSEVDAFANRMNAYFENEDDRRHAILPCLNRIFSARKGIQIPQLHAELVGSGGHNIATHGAGTIVVEFKNKITGINAIPHVELACHIARLNATKVDRQLYLRWRFPCLGLTIVGHLLTFYAVIAIDHRLKLVSLTPTFSCIQSASDGRDRRSLYLAFTAASVLQAHILQDVEKIQNNLPQEIPLEARHFPAVTKLRKYPNLCDDHLTFKIRGFFPDRQPYRLLYFAVTPDNQGVLIKFVQQYSIELHHFCAESGHAPRILAFERLPGGWHAIAMEFIDYGHTITASPQLSIHRDRWAEELRCLVDKFHLKGFVHGDLRDANMLCKEDSVMLLDFDWGGKGGEVFYPTANLNDELLEGRVSHNLRITKEGDIRVLGKTLAKLYDHY